MKIHLHIFVILIASLVFQTNEGFACGDTSKETKIESKQSNQNKSCCNNQSENEDCGGDCGGDCGNSSCHCTHSVSVPFLNETKLKISHHFNTAQKSWNFDQNLPNPIYLAIWTPPKIS